MSNIKHGMYHMCMLDVGIVSSGIVRGRTSMSKVVVHTLVFVNMDRYMVRRRHGLRSIPCCLLWIHDRYKVIYNGKKQPWKGTGIKKKQQQTRDNMPTGYMLLHHGAWPSMYHGGYMVYRLSLRVQLVATRYKNATRETELPVMQKALQQRQYGKSWCFTACCTRSAPTNASKTKGECFAQK